MKFDPDEQRALRDLFSTFEDLEVAYVVLRGYTDLPKAIPGSDVDLFVDANSFDRAIEACSGVMDAQESPLSGLLRVIGLGAREPVAAIRFVIDSPGEAKRYVHRSLTQTKFSDDKYVERSFGHGNLTVHLVNHLAYTSTLDGSPIRVDRPVEDVMIERRVYNEGFYVPSPADELAHLICRGVYDYQGSFPPRYSSRCDDLRDEVLDDEETKDQFRELLAWLFFEADELVYELVRKGAYDSIRNRLGRFSDY